MTLHEILNVSFDDSPELIKTQWGNQTRNPRQEKAYQLLLNPRYRKLYERTLDEDPLDRAGFFVEDANLKSDPFFQESFAHLEKSGEVVLVMTGSFDPVHNGHISAMQTARKVVEMQGHKVSLSILSPGHDDYAMTKRKDSFPISRRIHLLEEILKEHDEIVCGRWESLGNSSSVNFTSVIDFYKKVFPQKSIVYVFGEDNKYFSLVFENIFEWICIKRNNSCSDSLQIKMESHENQHLSSTLIRKNNELLNSQ